ncbi:Acetate kinase [Rhodovulum sp. PH10]|uniref:acetate/propionate family kinase n=1 Tax=Rhodovulum sp. PH10 TaxID=1187851 RepID=UPI00027C2662|nr:acetate/propionate family kinase [Rhodovulum sp. PH10]EJW11834.1 Acetate kinase [Rhodovulum sp. PH10]
MGDHVITLNAGSSSIKFALFDADGGEWPKMVATGQVEGIGVSPEFEVKRSVDKQKTKRSFSGDDAPKNHAEALEIIIGWLNESFPNVHIGAIGHRVVHGGPVYTEPVRIDPGVLAHLEAFSPLAPLHQPHNLAGIAAAGKAFPGIPQVACFDTAFHRTQPFVNDTFGIPLEFYEQGVRRYGFHGLSYEYITERLRKRDPQAVSRAVVLHLGNGASMCAIKDGQAVSSTMSFSPLDGLPMGTRCGQIDAAVLFYLIQQKGMSVEQVSDLLYKKSGLKGMSGISSDMRDLEASEKLPARQAIDYFVTRIRRELGALMAVTGGVESIVFTGGIGANSQLVRERVLDGFAWAGIVIDSGANARRGEEVISAIGSAVRVYVMQTDEEAMIARHTIAAARLSTSRFQKA